jgi:hypothetical protein
MLWAGATNTYLSRFARIQDDRGHTVVTSGPYGYVRHPMYLGVIVLYLCIPLALGSWRALLPGAANAVLMVIRARQEEVRRLRRGVARRQHRRSDASEAKVKLADYVAKKARLNNPHEETRCARQDFEIRFFRTGRRRWFRPRVPAPPAAQPD